MSQSISDRLRRMIPRLKADRTGVVAVEFAISLPLVLTVITYGAEAANLAYSTQLVGDITTQAGDSIARVRNAVTEDDVTEALNGVKTLGDSIKFAANGRIIVSSLQPVLDGSGDVVDQRIRWQRCKGALARTSSYGVADDLLGTAGMGPTGRQIAAAQDTEIIFVEVQYDYQPLVSSKLFGTRTISQVAALTVRDRTANDLVNTGTSSLCSTFTA
jgi:hypothetical protein